MTVCVTFQNGPYLVLERCLIPWLNNWNNQTICQFKHVNLHVCFTCPDTHINERNHLFKKHVDAQKRVVVDDFKAKNGQGLNEFLPRLDKEVGGEQPGVSVVNIQPTWQQKMWWARDKVRRKKRLSYIWVVFPRTGKMGKICLIFFIFEASLWPNGLIFLSFLNCSEEIMSVGV